MDGGMLSFPRQARRRLGAVSAAGHASLILADFYADLLGQNKMLWSLFDVSGLSEENAHRFTLAGGSTVLTLAFYPYVYLLSAPHFGITAAALITGRSVTQIDAMPGVLAFIFSACSPIHRYRGSAGVCGSDE
ncbi:MAG: hypothetical protein ACSLEN_06340 [Candidatus Malihini olakiniferum]